MTKLNSVLTCGLLGLLDDNRLNIRNIYKTMCPTLTLQDFCLVFDYLQTGSHCLSLTVLELTEYWDLRCVPAVSSYTEILIIIIMCLLIWGYLSEGSLTVCVLSSVSSSHALSGCHIHSFDFISSCSPIFWSQIVFSAVQ